MAVRVLFLITDLEIGGSPRVVRDLAVRLRSSEIETRVACLAPWGPVADEIRDAGISVTAFGATQLTHLPRTIRALRGLAKDVDVVYSFLVHANAVAALALRRLPHVRLIESIQTTQPNPKWHWRLQQWAARRAEAIVVPSASVATMAAERSSISRDRSTIIPNAINIDVFANLPHAIPSGSFRVGFIGRLDPIKRVGDLVAAVATLPDIRLDIFGDGAVRDRISRDIRHRSIGQRVTLHGAIAGARDALPTIDCLVLPSDAEGFGLVLIEAMAAGVPVIATDVPGIRDVVTHEETGLLVPPRSPAAIGMAITRLRSNDVLRDRMIAAARDHVRSVYAWDNVLPSYRRLLLKRG